MTNLIVKQILKNKIAKWAAANLHSHSSDTLQRIICAFLKLPS